jgi:hypothetical protein
VQQLFCPFTLIKEYLLVMFHVRDRDTTFKTTKWPENSTQPHPNRHAAKGEGVGRG